MEITVSARHTEVSPALRAAAEAKIGRLARYVGEPSRAEVHFSQERNPRISEREVCEVTLHGQGQGNVLHCKVAAADGFVAIDRAVEKLTGQIYKLKSKRVERYTGRRAARRATGFARA